MATVKLSADPREPHSKGGARRLRRAGRIPGILYGQGRNTRAVSFDYSDFEALLRVREGTVIVEVTLPGDDPQQTIIREIQRDPVTGRILHLDLLNISMTEMVEVEVPINIVGTAFGVKTEGGILEHHLRSVSVKCLPGEIPQRIDVDVSELHIGKSIHVSELPIFAAGVELLTDPKATVVAVIAPRIAKAEVSEEEAAAEAEAAAEEGEAGDEDKPGDKGADKGADKESA